VHVKLALLAAAVAALAPVQSLAVPRAAGVTAFGNTIYVRAGVGSTGMLHVYARDPRTGKLRQVQCVARHARACADGRGLETPAALAVSPDGRSVYVAAANGRSIGVYARARNGRLTSRGRQTGIAHPQSIAVSADGRSVYVAADRLRVFARAATGALRPVQTLPAGAGAVAVSPDGSTVYAGAGGGSHGSLTAYARDTATGRLTQTATVSSPATPGIEQPAQLVAVRDGVYAVGTVSGAVTRFDPDLTQTCIARSLPLAYGLAVTSDRVYVGYRDGVLALDRTLRPVATTRLHATTGVAAAGTSLYAVSSGRVTAYRR
jgi:6-phosphogluconolactonase (cycloisomerase 2 family)